MPHADLVYIYTYLRYPWEPVQRNMLRVLQRPLPEDSLCACVCVFGAPLNSGSVADACALFAMAPRTGTWSPGVELEGCLKTDVGNLTRLRDRVLKVGRPTSVVGLPPAEGLIATSAPQVDIRPGQ